MIVVSVWCVPLGVHGGERDHPGQSQVQRAGLHVYRGGVLLRKHSILKSTGDEYKGVA